MVNYRFVCVTAVLLTLIAGCKNGNSPEPATSGDLAAEPAERVAAEANADKPAAVSQPQMRSAAPPMGSVPDPLRGTVKETMVAGAYAYLLLATDSGEHWAAARAFPVSVGDEVEVTGLAAMPGFTSPTLNRTFDMIQFAGSAKVIGVGSAAKAIGSVAKAIGAEALSSAMPSGHPPVADVVVPPVAVIPTPTSAPTPSAGTDAGSNQLTIADLFAKKAELDGKLVTIRGRVVKANRGILGSNWLHLQDGTGEAPTNDITVTSKTGYADVGSTVVIVGKVALNRDFGSGYKYDVIVENASVNVEGE